MCIAVVVTKGKVLLEPIIDKCWKRNDHGAGVAYVKDGKVVISKGHMHLDDLKDAYFTIAKEHSSNMLVHFRIRTSGYTDRDNTHPFAIKGGAMIHNGVLFQPSGSKSDTRLMAEKWYNKFNKENLLLCKEQVGKVIGTYNKLAFLYDDDTFAIVNEASGNWDSDKACWFSNGGWK